MAALQRAFSVIEPEKAKSLPRTLPSNNPEALRALGQYVTDTFMESVTRELLQLPRIYYPNLDEEELAFSAKEAALIAMPKDLERMNDKVLKPKYQGRFDRLRDIARSSGLHHSHDSLGRSCVALEQAAKDGILLGRESDMYSGIIFPDFIDDDITDANATFYPAFKAKILLFFQHPETQQDTHFIVEFKNTLRALEDDVNHPKSDWIYNKKANPNGETRGSHTLYEAFRGLKTTVQKEKEENPAKKTLDEDTVLDIDYLKETLIALHKFYSHKHFMDTIDLDVYRQNMVDHPNYGAHSAFTA